MLALDYWETRNCDAPLDTALAAVGVGCLVACFAIAPAFYPDPTGWIQQPWHLALGMACFALGALRAISIWPGPRGEPTPAMIERFFRIKFLTLALSMTLGAISIAIGAYRWADLWGKYYFAALQFYTFVLLLRPEVVLLKHYAVPEQARRRGSRSVITHLRAAGLAVGVSYLVMQALLHFGALPAAAPLIIVWISASLGLGWVFTRLAVVFYLRFMFFYWG